MVNLASFCKTEVCGRTVLPERSLLKGKKLIENAKIQMRHFEQFSNNVVMYGCPNKVKYEFSKKNSIHRISSVFYFDLWTKISSQPNQVNLPSHPKVKATCLSNTNNFIICLMEWNLKYHIANLFKNPATKSFYQIFLKKVARQSGKCCGNSNHNKLSSFSERQKLLNTHLSCLILYLDSQFMHKNGRRDHRGGKNFVYNIQI